MSEAKLKNIGAFQQRDHPGNCTFSWSDDGETLFVEGKLERDSWAYPIEISRIPEPLALVNWIQHLCEKTWFNQWDARTMIDIVCDYRDWDQHQGW